MKIMDNKKYVSVFSFDLEPLLKTSVSLRRKEGYFCPPRTKIKLQIALSTDEKLTQWSRGLLRSILAVPLRKTLRSFYGAHVLSHINLIHRYPLSLGSILLSSHLCIPVSFP
jgi:hypothetical protein